MSRARPRTGGSRIGSCVPALLPLLACLFTHASAGAPLASDELARLCSGADGLAHCGRLVEEVQLKRLPNVATREGDVLQVALTTGQTSFTDTSDSGGRSYSLWDYLDDAEIVVIYATRGDDDTFLLVQRANGRTVEMPGEPRLSPDRQRIASADFCQTRCANELAVWRVTPNGIVKDLWWNPAERWSDATARWLTPQTLEIEVVIREGAAPRIFTRTLDQPGWKRAAAR